MDYQGSAVDLSEDFTVAASNVITTLAFGKEVSIFSPLAQFVSSEDIKEKTTFHSSFPCVIVADRCSVVCLCWELGKVTVYVALFSSVHDISAFIMC